MHLSPGARTFSSSTRLARKLEGRVSKASRKEKQPEPEPEVQAVPASRSIAQRRPSGVIVEEVAAKHGITYEDVVGHSRKRAIVLARREAIYRMRTETPLSLQQIGKALGGKDHTSVLHALRCHVEASRDDTDE